MAKPINLKHLTEEERGILVEAIPALRTKEKHYWEDETFKKCYKKWLAETNSHFHKDGGFSQFQLAISQMRKTMPNTYKLDTQDDSGTIIRKAVSETPTQSQLFKRYFGEGAE